MTITLRNLPAEVEKAILETSRREAISRNRGTLRFATGISAQAGINTDLNEFFGMVERGR